MTRLSPDEETRLLRESLPQLRADDLASYQEGSFGQAFVNFVWVLLDESGLWRLISWLMVRISRLLTRNQS